MSEEIDKIKKELEERNKTSQEFLELIEDYEKTKKIGYSSDKDKKYALLLMKSIDVGIKIKGKEAMKKFISENTTFDNSDAKGKKLKDFLLKVIDIYEDEK